MTAEACNLLNCFNRLENVSFSCSFKLSSNGLHSIFQEGYADWSTSVSKSCRVEGSKCFLLSQEECPNFDSLFFGLLECVFQGLDVVTGTEDIVKALVFLQRLEQRRNNDAFGPCLNIHGKPGVEWLRDNYPLSFIADRPCKGINNRCHTVQNNKLIGLNRSTRPEVGI